MNTLVTMQADLALRTWIIFGTASLLCLAGRAEAEAVVRPFESSGMVRAEQPIDEMIFARLEHLGIQTANRCSDAVFLRRAFLDVIGTLPTATEARDFLQSKHPNKRRALIDLLLERDEFAEYWAMKWSDLLRVKSEFPINLWPNAAQGYHRWIRTSLKENLPYDRFARELLTASGSNFRVPPVNFYRATQNRDPAGLAQTAALTFMGERAENWPPERRAGMAVFFSQIGFKETSEWKEEIVFFDREKARAGSQEGIFPDGTRAALSLQRDPRELFADWLISPENPWFSRNIVNRIWSWLLGRGIIHEPDDIRPDNPPSHPELLAYLEKELIGSGYDLKHIYRLILNSKTYQLSSLPKTDHPEAERNFAHYPLRRLDAEVLIDAINQITGATEKYSSDIPEPFTFLPENQRSIALPDGSISSAFLELFGRPARDTGLESERNHQPSAGQRLHLLNSSHIQRKLEQSLKLQAVIKPSANPREAATRMYMMILSRFPTEDELKIAEAYSQSGIVNAREAAIDLAWALINSAEFLYRH
jgi:hypothetical protein